MPTFRTLEQMRRHVLPDIQKVLESCGDLSSSWIQSGRLCSPRVLFTFNGSNDRLFEHDSKTSNPITVDRRKYELQMEDQLYRTLRNCRVITNICNNSLFAICNQVDFVFITRTTDHRAGVDTFFESLVDQFIDDFSNNISAFRKIEKSFEHQPRKLHTNFDQSAQTFFDFLWKHVDMALTKGFDDNVGKHNVGAYFQLPTLQSFLNVLCSMSSHFFKQNQTESELNNNLQNKLGKLLQIDRNFSQSFCVKVLNAAFAFYKENLPKNYPLQIHERKLNQSLQLFASLARGEATYHYAQILQSDCENYWRSGRQICSSRSLFSKYCALPLHEVPDLLELLMSNDDKTDTGKLLQHCSGIKYVSTCNCGLRQTNREDPFTVAEANWLFYRNLAQKCRCKDMQKVQFPIFCGSIDEARSVNVMLNQMMKMGFQKAVRDEKRDENDAPEEDEEYEDYEDNKYGDLHDNPVSSKRESEFLSQEFGNANAFKSQSGLGNDDSDSGRSLVGDREDEDEEDDDEVDPDEEEEDDYDDEEEGDDESANAFEAKLLNDKLIDRRNRVRRMSLVVESSPSKSKLICNEVTNEMQEDITCYSTDKYLLSMRNTLSPPNLLPLFCSWSLVRLGSSSVYSHNLGIQDQPGFLSGSHYLLPWNVNVKLEHCTELPSLWQGKYPPGIKNKKMFAGNLNNFMI